MIYAGGASLLLFILALAQRRHHLTGAWFDGTLGISLLVTFVAEITGTLAHISGVLLSAPVCAVGAWAVVRSRWKLGDLSLLILFAGIGLGIAYIIAAAFDPDTGSYGDQGAIWLIASGVVLGTIAVASSGWMIRRRRIRNAPN